VLKHPGENASPLYLKVVTGFVSCDTPKPAYNIRIPV
jgi:hypothetical protein